MPGSTWRFGPRKASGDARCEKIGSVSTVAPPACTSIVAWPIQVTAGSIARRGRGVAAQEREVGGHHRCRRPRRLRQAVAQRIGAPLQQRRSPFGSKST